MSYKTALTAAGALVHIFEEFGSYQGQWWAKVTYNGVTGWTEGYYGSCSSCDSYQAEFGNLDDQCEEHRYGKDNPNCPDCQKAKADLATRLESFGKHYLEDVLLTQEEAIKKASKNLDWDDNAQEMVEFIKVN